MRIPSSATKSESNFRRPIGLCLLLLFAVASAGVQPFRPAAKFEGKTIPEPPAQGTPWTAPATRLPGFVVDATAALFEQGVADPRDCEYRDVEVGEERVVKTRGFVLPERVDAPGRFVVCWDGLVHPALTVGEPAELDFEIKELADRLRQAREDASSNQGGGAAWRLGGRARNPFEAAGVDEPAPIKLCLLLRLGRADLAEAVFASATGWTPGARRLTAYGISYLSLAVMWAGLEFTRLADAHRRGDDVIALDAARRLARFRDRASAKIEAMGFLPSDHPGRFRLGSADSSPWFVFLDQFDDLLRDQERRAREAPRDPIPPPGGDPTARIAALIRDLDQIGEQPVMMGMGVVGGMGGQGPGGSGVVKELIAEGAPAVGPLLDVLASDDRLTRSVDFGGRGGTVNRLVRPVHEFAFTALVGILKTGEFDGRRPSSMGGNSDPASRRALVDSMRQFWEKTRSIPLAERWYRTLLDDAAGSARWLEAAGGLVRVHVKPEEALAVIGPHPMNGYALREGREPSVTELIQRRARGIAGAGAEDPFRGGLRNACQMGFFLADWAGRESLPLLKELCGSIGVQSDLARRREPPQAFDPSLASALLRLIETRVRFGDDAALDDYADWLRTTSPSRMAYASFDLWRLLVAHSDRPSMAAAARWLFTNPESPWVPLVPGTQGLGFQHNQQIVGSALLVAAGFREGVLAGLADRAPLGTAVWHENQVLELRIGDSLRMRMTSPNLDAEGVKVGEEHPFRNCDYLAQKLSVVEGCPRIELYWPEDRRNQAVAACITYLKRYGDRFTTARPPGSPPDFPLPRAHLAFPILDRPATRADADAGRAVFSVEGEGETRVADLPGGLPQKVRWTTLKDSPYTAIDQNGPHRAYRTEGHVWQVEEVRKGDGWERWYGFVGQHTVGRAPASEIELEGRAGP